MQPQGKLRLGGVLQATTMRLWPRTTLLAHVTKLKSANWHQCDVQGCGRWYNRGVEQASALGLDSRLERAGNSRAGELFS